MINVSYYGIYLTIFTVLLCGSNSSANPVSYESKNLPIIRINVDALPPIDIGVAVGRSAKTLFPDIESLYDRSLAKMVTPLLYNKIFNSLPTLLKNMDQAYQKELQGVASAWSLTGINKRGDGLLSFDEYVLLNVLPDIGLAPNGSGFAVMGNAAENGAIVGRNLDWDSSPELRSLQAITVYQYEDKTIVNIGFAGIISILSGFNDEGLFLAIFNAERYTPYTKPYQIRRNTYPLAFAVRKVLETTHSVTQASRHLARNNYAVHNAIMMADRKSIQILEYSSHQKWGVRMWRSKTHKPWGRFLQIAAVDCHMLASMPDNCKDMKDNYHWIRLRELAQFSPSQPANQQQISKIISDTANEGYELFNQDTLQSMTFIPATAGLYLYAAPPNSGRSPVVPVYQPYLDLLPKAYRQEAVSSQFSFSVFMGLLLLVLLSFTLWALKVTILKELVKKIKKSKD